LIPDYMKVVDFIEEDFDLRIRWYI
jgi:hypothetical protein